jgi:hypothetical protein
MHPVRPEMLRASRFIVTKNTGRMFHFFSFCALPMPYRVVLGEIVVGFPVG